MPLNISTATRQAIHSKEVSTFHLFELHYIPPDFAAAGTSYAEGDIVFYDNGSGDVAYTALRPNPAPAYAPDHATQGATYWELTEYPLCMTDWSVSVAPSSG